MNNITKEENLLENIKLRENNTIKSTDLVDIINCFREVEGKAMLRHNDFMTKIRKELETLQSLGLDGERNISQSSYINSQNKKQPGYELNCEGMLMMLNSESTLVRYKTVEFVKKLQEKVEQLESDNKELYKIATSDEERAIREYNANKIKFGWKNIRRELESCDYKSLEDCVDNIYNFHTEVLKPKDRAYEYSKLDKTQYKQFVRDRLDSVLTDICNMTNDGVLRTISYKLINDTLRDKIGTLNRKYGQLVKK